MNKVQKALSPEEMTLISNIESMLGELKAQGGAGMDPMAAPAPVAEQQAPIMREDDEEKIGTTDEKTESIDKELETSESDSATASDDAEERIDETQTELTEEGVDEVAKQLIKMLRGSGTVKKSKPPVNPIIAALGKVVEVQKSTQSQVDGIENALTSIMDGLGLFKEMEIAKAEQTNLFVHDSD